ncbi:RAM signaling network component [Saxophila tyrrhenica]|uniref:RAM signaling network component n=1 Tax=Saxophila tyrrhenica TaxID=1690608 RepID=A0AAV9PH23_9PEZI|nr:RAM signaling network component [Saxophila tyrrhenica]
MSWANKTPMTVAGLVAHTKKELDADSTDKQAKLLAASVGELPKESQNGATLDLSRQNISALPVEVIELIKDRVERLALSHNPSVALPSQIVECERIRYLNIRWNDLERFPDVVLRMTKLEILDISKNRIEAIPDGIKSMTSLKFLAVARNNIRRLPLALGEMPSLQKLKFDENPIEFPPPDAIKLPKKSGASSLEAEREKETCKAVKAYLKDVAMKQRVRTTEEETSESNVETPRPPKRTATIGRFPIRPSISGIANGADLKSSSPSDHPPPIPQRSHARVASTASSTSMTPPTPKRPGVAPLRANGNDMMRSRSETAASASLRSRRQGYVPKRDRKVTGELNPLAEAPSETPDRSSQASTIKPTHSRATSTLSTTSSVLHMSGGETSSGPGSPTDMMASQSGLTVRPRRTKTSTIKDDGSGYFARSVQRLAITFHQLQRPIDDVLATLESSTSPDPALRRCVAEANATAFRVDDTIRSASSNLTRMTKGNLLRMSHQAIKAYAAVAATMKRNVRNTVRQAEAIYLRFLMLQIYSTILELRNICTVLGFTIRDRPNPRDPRTSRAWSSRTVTPTQPKGPSERRSRRPTVLQTSSSATIRPMAPPPMPVHSNGSSRTNTMSSMSAATPRSGESFSALHSSRPNVSRANTMRSMMDVSEPDDQFEQIFLKLRMACEQAGQALQSCRIEFHNRRNEALSVSQPRPASQWKAALEKCDIVSNNTKYLKNRLEMVKVNDPTIRFQRDFWQLCDAFVHSWIDLATEIKDLGSQRGVDVTSVKLIMRHVQKLVKDVSKTISHSPLYHHALGTKMPESAHSSLAPPFPAGLQRSFSEHPSSSGAMGAQNPYITSGPATPLSAALGPAAHTVASTPSATSGNHRDYFQDPTMQQSWRSSSHGRTDTVMQAPPRQGRRQMGT